MGNKSIFSSLQNLNAINYESLQSTSTKDFPHCSSHSSRWDLTIEDGKKKLQNYKIIFIFVVCTRYGALGVFFEKHSSQGNLVVNFSSIIRRLSWDLCSSNKRLIFIQISKTKLKSVPILQGVWVKGAYTWIFCMTIGDVLQVLATQLSFSELGISLVDAHVSQVMGRCCWRDGWPSDSRLLKVLPVSGVWL